MKYLHKYESYKDIENRQNQILDKISMHGINSLTDLELDFLNSFKDNQQISKNREISLKEIETVFEDDFGKFRFELGDIQKFDDELKLIGKLYFIESGKSIIMEGDIIKHSGENISINFFDKNDIDVFEICSGFEYELDSFAEYVVSSIEEKGSFQI